MWTNHSYCQKLLGLDLLLRVWASNPFSVQASLKFPLCSWTLIQSNKVCRVLRVRLMYFSWVWALVLEATHLPVHSQSQQVQKFPVGMPRSGDDSAMWEQAQGCFIIHKIQMHTLQSPTLSYSDHFAGLHYEVNTWGLRSSYKTSLVSSSWNVLLTINFFVLPKTFCPLLPMYSANVT